MRMTPSFRRLRLRRLPNVSPTLLLFVMHKGAMCQLGWSVTRFLSCGSSLLMFVIPVRLAPPVCAGLSLQCGVFSQSCTALRDMGPGAAQRLRGCQHVGRTQRNHGGLPAPSPSRWSVAGLPLCTRCCRDFCACAISASCRFGLYSEDSPGLRGNL